MEIMGIHVLLRTGSVTYQKLYLWSTSDPFFIDIDNLVGIRNLSTIFSVGPLFCPVIFSSFFFFYAKSRTN
ncbi:Uncharacterized protein TCM_039169 [Theobroma cacao]|uniref:Uncharacterized protein n=1 Tax=Theobroma cacao TaxID=3641 RepID=A0A061GR27_THECC|nr:Uncharacterized protein TCM_039169 [Theobroma cacao]